MTKQVNMFIPITKVNAQRREVWGWAAIEEPDNSDEILDYESSKPHFLDWSNRAQKRSGGKSLGNVRSMHKNIAAGKLIELRPDDVSKGFYVGAKIIDDNEWKKVESGVYTGFSVGGSYLKRWNDFRNPGKMRYTAKPTELSIVDSPCIPSATFEMLKMDGSKSLQKFQPTQGKNMIKVVSRTILVKYDESEHPRASDGKFTDKGGGGGGGSKGTESDSKLPERSPMHEIYGQNEPAEGTRAKMRVQNMGAKAKANFARFKEEHPDKYEEALAIYGKGGTSTDAIDAVMKPSSSRKNPSPEGSIEKPNWMKQPRPEAGYEHNQGEGFGMGQPSDSKQAPAPAKAPKGIKEMRAWAAKNRLPESDRNEFSAKPYYHPEATARAQRMSLFSYGERNGDKGWNDNLNVTNKETGDRYEVTVDEMRHLLFDEPQDNISRWKIDEIKENIDNSPKSWEERGFHGSIVGQPNQHHDDLVNQIERENLKAKNAKSGKITKGDVMNKLERLYAILDDVEEELKKADVPESPESISDIPLKGDYGSETVEQMPAPNVLMELEANSEPSQEVLASHAVKSEDLTKAFEAWLPKVGKMVKSIVAEALAEAAIDLEKSAPARIIKVNKE